MPLRLEDHQLITVLQQSIKKVGSMRKWAKTHDLSVSFISDVIRGRRNITKCLAEKLGFEPATRQWVRIKSEY